MHSPDVLVQCEFTVNRAMVIDIESGELVLEQDKIRFYKEFAEETHLSEAIIGSKKLKIGIADWGTFCVMICKDFVDEEAPLVEHLDVDYILVPSMGRSNTSRAWRKAAETLERRWGGHSALALQQPPDRETWIHTPTGEGDFVGKVEGTA
jgi:predicted amidohydrolase